MAFLLLHNYTDFIENLVSVLNKTLVRNSQCYFYHMYHFPSFSCIYRRTHLYPVNLKQNSDIEQIVLFELYS